jgi:hypothetical protein
MYDQSNNVEAWINGLYILDFGIDFDIHFWTVLIRLVKKIFV